MAPKRDVHCFPERAAQRELAVVVVDHKAPPRDTWLHQRDRDRIVRVTKVHQHFRTEFSEKGKRGTKSFNWLAAQYLDGDGFSDAKDLSYIRNGIGALAPGPDYLVVGMGLCSNQIFKETRVPAFAIKLRHYVDTATSISRRNWAAPVCDTAYFTPD
jgi:hypothetical protein